MFPIEDLGAGFYQVNDPSSLAQVFGRSGILGHLAFRADGTPSSDSGTIAIDFTASELGVRVNGIDYTLNKPTKAYPLNTLENAEQSLLLSTSPFKYNRNTAGQAIEDPITGFYQLPLGENSRFEFWYTTPDGKKIYSSDDPSRFELSNGNAYGALRINADALLNEEGDPLFSTYALSTFTSKLEANKTYTVRLSSASGEKNQLKIYRVDDASGAINGVLPWEQGYADLAERRVIKSYASPGLLKKSQHDNLKVNNDSFVASYLVNRKGEKLFPWSEANPGGTDALIRVSDKAYAFDSTTGSAKDYQDLIYSIEAKTEANAADLIITAKAVTSVDLRNEELSQAARAIAIKDGVIIGLGSAKQILKEFQGPDTAVERHNGSYLFPGFVDPHEHFFTLANYALLPTNSNVTWPALPDDASAYENITQTLIQELAKFEREYKDDPDAWYGAFGLDPSMFGNPNGSTGKDSLSTIYQQAFALPPKELTTPTPGYGDGQTYINWLNYIAAEADRIEPGAGRRKVAVFYSSGHGIAINAPAVEELVELGKIDPKYNFSILQSENTDPNGGQPAYITDGVGGYFLRDGEYGREGYFTGIALEPEALAPITEAYVLSRTNDIFGKLGSNQKANGLNHASVGVTTANDKSYGALTGSVSSEFKLQGFLQTSGYQPIRLFVDPLSIFAFDSENNVRSDFSLTPYHGNLSASPKAVKFILDGSDQAMTGFMPADDPYVVKANGSNGYNPSFILFQETASGWQPVGIRDNTYGPSPDDTNNALTDQLKKLWDRGWGFHAHTNGQQATTAMLEAYKTLKRSPATATNGAPQVLALEHLPFATKEQLKDLGQLGGYASFTKGHIQHAYQFGWDGESYDGTGIVGKERGNGVVPVKTAKGKGVKVSMHSDFPIDWIGRLNSALRPDVTFVRGPIDFMNELSTRRLTGLKKSANTPSTVVNPSEKLTREEAFLATTLSAAKNMSFEPWIGSLSVGKLADMTLLDRNILDQKVPLRYASGSSKGVSIQKTWVGGEPIYVL